MNTKRTAIVISLAMVLAHWLAGVEAAFGQTTNWTAGTGNWNTAGNWSAGVPDAGSPTRLDATIANGGTAQQLGPPSGSARGVRVGRAAGAGQLLVDAATLNVTQLLHVNDGSAGPASMTVQNGSTVSAPSTIVGFISNHNASALITGAGTVYNAATQFIVGNVGTGTASLTVENGAMLTSGVGSIGEGAGSTGVAIVRGAGSQWISNGFLDVGDLGTGTLTIEDQGLVHVGTHLSINSASTVNLNGGTLRFNTIGGTGGLSRLAPFYTAGTIQLAGNRSVSFDPTITTLFGAVPTIPSGKGLTIEGTTQIGVAGPTTNINGKLTSLSSAVVNGSFAGNNVRVSGAGSLWNVSGGLSVGDFEGASGSLLIENGGTVTSNFAQLGDSAGAVNASANVSVSGPGSSWTTVGNFTVGELSALGSLSITNGGLVDVGGTLNLASNGFVALGGGTLRFNGFSAATFANFSYQSGTIRLIGNRTVGSDSAINSFFGSPAVISTGKGLTIDGTTTIADSLTLDGGTLSVGSLVNNGTFNFQSGTLTVTQSGTNVDTPILTTNLTAINVNANNVSIGRAASFDGFQHHGTLNVGGNTATLNSAGYARLGTLTTLAGGTINAPNGVALATGSNLVGTGNVAARLTGELGSVIEASGALALGEGSSPAGFNYAGELRTRQHAMTLNSSAQAALGNLTTLGSGATPGILNATNGIAVDFGDAIIGFGTISSTNTLAKRTIINGVAQGTSVAQPLTFTGYVKGVGTFDNVNFTGTFSPGLSPSILTVGNVAFSPTSTLVMELGGATPGSGYDQIQSSGTLALDGTLQVALINGFSPVAGQAFNILDWGSLAGAFTTLNLPTLAGLAWNTAKLYTTGTLSLDAAGLPGDYNQNGTVDAADYVLWRNNLGSGTSLPNDDTPGVGPDDYTRWRAHFGQTAGSGETADLPTSANVPEPTCAVLAACAALAATIAQRRTRTSIRYS